MWPLRKCSSCVAAVLHVPLSRVSARLRKFIYKNAKKYDLFWLFGRPDFFSGVFTVSMRFVRGEEAKGTCYTFKCKYLGAMPCCRRIRLTFECAAAVLI